MRMSLWFLYQESSGHCCAMYWRLNCNKCKKKPYLHNCEERAVVCDKGSRGGFDTSRSQHTSRNHLYWTEIWGRSFFGKGCKMNDDDDNGAMAMILWWWWSFTCRPHPEPSWQVKMGAIWEEARATDFHQTAMRLVLKAMKWEWDRLWCQWFETSLKLKYPWNKTLD